MNRFSDATSSRSSDREKSRVPGTESSASSSPSAGANPGGDAPAGAVFCADPALANEGAASLPEGFAGRLSLRDAGTLGYEETVSALQRLGMLVSWAQAQQARVAARLEVLFARDIADASGREEPALAMSLAAAEASAVLNIPHMTAMQLISESSRLCADAPETLARLSEGKIAIQHARIILEETHNLPTDIEEPLETPTPAGNPAAEDTGDRQPDCGQLDLGLDGLGRLPDPDGSGKNDGSVKPAGSEATADNTDAPAEAEVLSVRGRFERDLLAAAEGRTAAGFGRRARRLRESRFPDLIPVRHRQAKDKRRVMFQPLPDGMSCLSAVIAAEKGQAMFAALTGAAKAGKRAGDPRTMDQLRADTLTALLLDGEPGTLADAPWSAPSPSCHNGGPVPTNGRVPTTPPVPTTGPSFTNERASSGGPGPAIDSSAPLASAPRTTRGPKRPRRAERHRDRNRSKVRTEVMVLINADTLAGLNENPGELNGYGPVSAETARTMILDALHWTPLLQDPTTGEILNVGRTRRIPAGLKRWLQARDGTCRFPGCSVSVTHAQIDHTTPYSHGGPTDHTNLEHLCPKHHRFKTLGHWKARQPEAGTIEWTSPTGRTYTTDPALDYFPTVRAPEPAGPSQPEQPEQQEQPSQPQQQEQPDDDPPPF